jgi:hypothetical protein
MSSQHSSRDAEFAATIAVGLAKLTGSQLHVVTIAEEYPHYEAYWPLAERSQITANRATAPAGSA